LIKKSKEGKRPNNPPRVTNSLLKRKRMRRDIFDDEYEEVDDSKFKPPPQKHKMTKSNLIFDRLEMEDEKSFEKVPEKPVDSELQKIKERLLEKAALYDQLKAGQNVATNKEDILVDFDSKVEKVEEFNKYKIKPKKK
jgi:hypothetical protein